MRAVTTESYIKEVHANLPRLLALVDRDVTSDSYGLGDRYHWAWGLIDFGNATFQGMANGLARLWCHGLWPYETTKKRFLERIDSIYRGAEKLTRPDGSLEEAFPNEGSFCVTSLVAFDLLVACDLLSEQLDQPTKERWVMTIRPMIAFLMRAEETHAVISNHLATAVAALVRWHRLTGEARAETRARALLDRILGHQSEEGWFLEYQGADPGYQSLCTCYLADVHKLRPDWQLLEPLRRSLRFLWHFAHPDGSFGGLYGSRCTRFYYPAGILALADEIPEAAVLANFMASSIGKQQVVTLSSIDEPNLVPTFNAYCWAAALAHRTPVQSHIGQSTLPAFISQPLRIHYTLAGLVIDRGEDYYTIVATGKGGGVYHFAAGQSPLINAGVVVRHPNGRLGCSQGTGKVLLGVDQEILTISSPIMPMPKQCPSPWQFLVLRLLCVTVFRFSRLREWVKRILVRILITGGKPWPVENQRTIRLGKRLEIKDDTHLPSGYEIVKGVNAFVPIHMASQGYWQRQDEEGA